MTGAVPARLRFGPDGPRVEWLPLDGAPFSEPFFDQTLSRLRRATADTPFARRSTPVDALCAVAAGLPVAGLIFHVSRCGSTLLAQMLAALPRHVVVAEAPVIDDILRGTRRDPDIGDEERIAWLRGAVAALGRRKTPAEERVFMKLDSWSIFDLPLVRRAFPGVPLLFLHRDPLEVLVSLMRKPSITLIRDTVTPAQLELSIHERNALSREEHAAAILGAFFREATRHRADLVPVDYQDLPDFVRERLPGGNFNAVEQAVLQAVPLRNAKEPAEHFTPDAAAKRQAASPAAVAAVQRWTKPHYDRWLAAIEHTPGT